MSEVKIKTLPRTNDKPKSAAPSSVQQDAQDNRSLAKAFIALSFAAFAIGVFGFYSSQKEGIQRQLAKAASPQVDRVSASINRRIYDAHLMEQMMRRKQQLENQATAPGKGHEALALDEDNRNYGVQMDQENTAERLYKELKLDKSTYGDNLEEKVNSRLANRKWLNEMERAERLNFVKNFIRQAYDRGYEVELDENLVVTGVRKITKKMSIDQVLNKLAKEGR